MAAEDYIPDGSGLPRLSTYATRWTAEERVPRLEEQLRACRAEFRDLNEKHEATLEELADARDLLFKSVKVLAYLDEAVKHCVPGRQSRGPIQEVLRDLRNVMRRKGFVDDS